MESIGRNAMDLPAAITIPGSITANNRSRSFEKWMKMIANILFEVNVGWWQTWTFSGDFENPNVFYPILLMALRAISWMDVAFSILFLFACAQALCGLLKDHKKLLKTTLFSFPPFVVWRTLCLIFYVCVAVIQNREMLTLYRGRVGLIIYLLLWFFTLPLDVMLFICVKRQLWCYNRGHGHPMNDILHGK
ncbi:hypothetical protein RvY_14579 [Ramazzottius varieornatus]|uniref:Transmembrane protein n=1 Tax=Ramazzottius varieornatus TaxID=947166 RepID=A0A1D1VZ25_RAMVA|nr:hypothetical protein RvY_14579 [Ramazzottius varieornatus]